MYVMKALIIKGREKEYRGGCPELNRVVAIIAELKKNFYDLVGIFLAVT
ncbi:MAG: hypothetical protein ACRCST_00895 [Turicibacter sp.]